MSMNKFLFASMIMVGMSACSKDDVVSNGENVSEGNAYMALSISMPNANGSRANTTTEDGTVEEQTVSNMSVFIWPKNPSEEPLIARHYTANELTKQGNIYSTKEIPVKKAGNHRVAVIVNGYTTDQEKQALEAFMTTPEKLRNIQTLTADLIKKISKPNHFLMTNANTTVNQKVDGSLVAESKKNDGEFYEDGTVSVDVKGKKDSPTKVTIPVERSVAKIEDVTPNYDITVEGRPEDHVVFQQVALVNANTKFYLVKQVRPISSTVNSGAVNNVDYTKDENNYYIVDPNFENQNEETINDFLFREFKPAQKDIEWKNLVNEGNLKTTFYSLENTMTANEQMNAFTTGLYYKAQYKINNQVGNVYNYYGKVYNWEKLIQVPNVKADLNKLNKNQEVQVGDEQKFTAEQLNGIGVVKYENGICYYPYWIRHIENPENLAPMEFGVVRNNWYKMTIGKVRGIGSVTPENPDPNTPDENPDTMLEVLVKVMPWTVRNNNIEF